MVHSMIERVSFEWILYTRLSQLNAGIRYMKEQKDKYIILKALNAIKSENEINDYRWREPFWQLDLDY